MKFWLQFYGFTAHDDQHFYFLFVLLFSLRSTVARSFARVYSLIFFLTTTRIFFLGPLRRGVSQVLPHLVSDGHRACSTWSLIFVSSSRWNVKRVSFLLLFFHTVLSGLCQLLMRRAFALRETYQISAVFDKQPSSSFFPVLVPALVPSGCWLLTELFTDHFHERVISALAPPGERFSFDSANVNFVASPSAGVLLSHKKSDRRRYNASVQPSSC